MTTYERTCQIERAPGDAPGLISGVLATDGEASDGHILDIDGLETPERAPLLFGHDDFTGTGNLGSWTAFAKFKGRGLGASGVRGVAQIELDGSGSQQAFRQDVALMVERGHIPAFSVRWDPIGDPVERASMPKDHPAHVDPKAAKGRQRWGLFFPRSRLLEGSVVTLGADPAALIGRMQEAEGDVRGYWRKAINHALLERSEVASLVAVELGSGDTAYVERAVYDAMLELANERLQLALDIHERIAADAHNWGDEPSLDEIRSEGERTQRDDPEETATPATPEPIRTATLPVITKQDMASLFGEVLKESESRLRAQVDQEIRRATGRVSR